MPSDSDFDVIICLLELSKSGGQNDRDICLSQTHSWLLLSHCTDTGIEKMRHFRRAVTLATCNAVTIAAVLIFMAGYFRSQPRFIALERAWLSDRTQETQSEAPFDKVIFMLVDGLRSDFVYGEKSGFNYTQSLIRTGEAVPFTAKAAAPTLTVSRLKALTQGTPQSFLDAFLNVLNSTDAMSLEGDDTWLSRLKASRNGTKKMVYIGVDMWLMLYPDIFDRAESLAAYYLPDFTSIDASIARSLPHELDQNDWTALVMHFDGLDCIAHQGGISSSHMLPKQQEMDDIVRLIHTTLTTSPHHANTLLVLLGDHGLTEGGNHGGDTPGEMASAMAFLSPRFASSQGRPSPLKPSADYSYYSTIQQVDLVPTLAGLLGFGIPARSTGVFVPELLDAFDSPEKGLGFLYENAGQLKGVYDLRVAEGGRGAEGGPGDSYSCGGECDGIEGLWRGVEMAYREYKSAGGRGRVEGLRDRLREFSGRVQEIVSRPLDDLHYPLLIAGLASIVTSGVVMIVSYRQPGKRLDESSWILLAFLAIQGVALFYPNLVAGEHMFWYPASLSWIWYLGYHRNEDKPRMKDLLMPISLQVLIQCFDLNNPSPRTLARWIDGVLDMSPVTVWILAMLPYLTTARNLFRTGTSDWALVILSVGALSFLELLFKACSVLRVNPEFLSFLPESTLAVLSGLDRNAILQLFWSGLIILAGVFYTQDRLFKTRNFLTRLVGIANLYLMSQTRVRNNVLYAMFDCQIDWLLSQDLNLTQITMSGLIFGQSAFFAFGRDNSFGSVDLTNGFNGLDGTSVPPVFFQTLCSNWVGPTWWSFACLRLLSGSREGSNRRSSVSSPGEAPVPEQQPERMFLDHLALQTISTTVHVAAVMLACLWLRHEETLWTIMAPKYVIMVVWVVFHQFVVNVVICSGFWSLV